jgi:hypothetical protein
MSDTTTIQRVRRVPRLIAGIAAAAIAFSGIVLTSEPANAAGYLCQERACPNGAQWAAARGASNQNSY